MIARQVQIAGQETARQKGFPQQPSPTDNDTYHWPSGSNELDSDWLIKAGCGVPIEYTMTWVLSTCAIMQLSVSCLLQQEAHCKQAYHVCNNPGCAESPQILYASEFLDGIPHSRLMSLMPLRVAVFMQHALTSRLLNPPKEYKQFAWDWGNLCLIKFQPTGRVFTFVCCPSSSFILASIHQNAN